MDEKTNDIISAEISEDNENENDLTIDGLNIEKDTARIAEDSSAEERTSEDVDLHLMADDVITDETVEDTADIIPVKEEKPKRRMQYGHLKKDADETRPGKLFMESFLTKNAVLTQAVGLCPLLALSVSVKNGLFISAFATIVLIVSNILISLLSRTISERVRIPVFLMIITGIVTVLSMLFEAFVPNISMSLGLYIPLIAVDSLILLRADEYARNHSFVYSAVDGLATGLGFTVIMIIMSVIRELLGSGSIYGIKILPESFPYFTFILLPFGGFLVLGLLIALYNRIFSKK